ncbi:Siderophore Ferric reductase (AHA_1954 family) [Alkalihalophilus pseudofirmus OF4]|uniref:Siderophore Ferric reductase (AHA_1954 family) n=1 Tax=Alkalihalophilus pseudofirmus (strain ATCC BAA-2126 / JCM 17055 / OF4) TaxID=398511 RepID=D3FVQ1_ALKPO|nr:MULTISPECIES: hypothetical protein [Alkalihalophilus]ADC48566.1 Siderophore Ferric reductase (AHA_1954 family) [Alkalihalophilus pseudofirmus OF4]MED1600938.1 hypothetical protein [Alkalihalophilus marmarensis]
MIDGEPFNQDLKKELEATFFIKINQLNKEADSYYKLNELQKEAVMNEVMKERTAACKGLDERAGGANMMKWVAYLCTAHQYTVSHYDSWLDYEDLAFYVKGDEVGFSLIKADCTKLPEGDREKVLTEKYKALFDRLRPVIEMVALTSTLPIQQAFGLLCNPFYKQQEAWMVTADDERKKQINDDLHTLREVDCEVFGLKRNPYDVTFRYVDSWWEPIEPVRVKAACCMSYVKEGGKKCYACPKLTKEERKARGEEIKREKSM